MIVFFLVKILLFFLCLFFLNFGGLPLVADESVMLTGRQFEFDGRANLMKATGAVRYTHDGFVMTGDTSVYHAAENMVELSGNVTLEKEGLSLQCPLLRVHLDSDMIYALDGARILYLDYQGVSDRIHFNIRNKHAIMKGQAYLLRGNDKLSSDRIILDLEKQTVKTEGNTQITVNPDTVKDAQ